MGCLFRCFSSHGGRRTLSRRKLTFRDRGNSPRPRVASESTAGSNVLEENNPGGVGNKAVFDKDVEAYEPLPARDTVRGDSEVAVKAGNGIVGETDGDPREIESAPASVDPVSREVSSSDADTSVDDSLFSISIESRDDPCWGLTAEKEVSSPIRVESPVARNTPKSGRCFGQINGAGDNCHGMVLSSVENLLPSTPPIMRPISPLKNHHHHKEENKENAGASPEDILRSGLKLPDCNPKPASFLPDGPQSREVSVDASLSSWLAESDSTPESQQSAGRSFGYSPLRISIA